MANRLVGNVIILDTSADNFTVPSNMKIAAVALYGLDTSSRLTLTYPTSADSFVSLSNQNALPGLSSITFGSNGVYFSAAFLRVDTLIAGTGFVYLA